MDETEVVSPARNRPSHTYARTPHDRQGRGSSVPVDGLRVALGELAQLSASSLSLSEFSVRVGSFLTGAIPDVHGAAIVVYHSDRPSTTAADCDFARGVDALHYELGEGPCISATAEWASKRSGALGSDPMWPVFGPRALLLGARSALALPLVAGVTLVGAIALYSREQNAFAHDAVEAGQHYALAAAASIQTAEALTSAIRVAGNLKAATLKRVVVDQAVGILISRNGSTPDKAFEELRLLSQRDHRKLHDVAQRLVNQTVLNGVTPRAR